jgi:hypothetical protein
MDERGIFPSAGQPASQVAAAADHRAAPAREAAAAPGAWDPGLTRDEGIAITTEMVLQLAREQSPDDASAAPSVTAEWALWGKEANETAYRVLRCSDGTFGVDDFREIINRYATGVKGELPQYTVCWIPSEQDHPAYLAVAIHELADLDPRRSGGRSRTAGGREIEYVRLFCVSYAEMAERGVSYTQLIDSVRECQLLPGDTAPLTVALLETAPYPVASSFRRITEDVVALLLTTRPVCVLGAERATAEERLVFIELVMSLLPYGLRSRLSASTWASSTAQDLKLRLFFANARRDDGSDTSYVTWGVPAHLDLPVRQYDDSVRLYLDWLRQVGSRAAPALAEATQPLRFSAADIRRMVAVLPRDRSVTETLEDLADSLRKDDRNGVRGAVDRLKRHLATQEGPADREAYRQVIHRRGLLKDRLGLHPGTRAKIYRVLIPLAFDTPLTYGSYCQLEHIIGGQPPLGTLRKVMLEEFKFASFIPFILVAKAEPGFRDHELSVVLFQHGIQPTAPIDQVAELAESIKPEHRAIVYDFAVHYLREAAEDPWGELKRRGYLAEMLDGLFPGNIKAQRTRLEWILRFGYGEQLSRGQIDDLFDHSSLHPTAALEEAVRAMAASPRAVQHIAEQAAFARLSNAGYADDALIVARSAKQRSRTPIGERVRLIPRGTIYTGILVAVILAFAVILVLTASHV